MYWWTTIAWFGHGACRRWRVPQILSRSFGILTGGYLLDSLAFYFLTKSIASVSRSYLQKYYMDFSYSNGVENGENMIESVCNEWFVVYMAAFKLYWQIFLVFSQGSCWRSIWLITENPAASSFELRDVQNNQHSISDVSRWCLRAELSLYHQYNSGYLTIIKIQSI